MIIKRNKQNQQPKPKQPVVEKNEQQEFSAAVPVENPTPQAPKKEIKEDTTDIFEGFNFDSIDYSQRAERRRGDRRRGYRRIDDRNLISRAQEEAISIKEEASKEGFQKGLEDAQETVYQLKEAVSGFFEYKEELYNQVSGDILEIALKVAQKIIKKEVETDKSVLESIVRDALKTLAKDENKIILKVNPADVEYTKEIVPQLLSSGQFEAKIFVSGDKDIEEGSALIETSNGVIDANISTQLELIKEAFKQI